MARLSDQTRKKMPKSAFAYVDSKGEAHLPIHDAAHVRNAIARFPKTDFETKTARERARQAILRAARKFDIEVSEDSEVSKKAQ